MHALIVLAVLPGVVRARQLRSHLGTQPACSGQCTPGRTTYDLRRLRHHGLIERIKGRLAYRVTDLGTRTALLYLQAYDAVVGPGLADITADIVTAPKPMMAMAKSFRVHRHLILNHFRACKVFSSGVVEGLNNKAKVGMRRAYGNRSDDVLEVALFHQLGALP